ncbi:ankyrin repeat domain-containing protein [Janthinobacterium lividum]|uniref:Ankyrin repeat domain-containing protein n=1 Tax=Janthinobacterium lividum TaxID=29581 RepID=A0A5C4NXR3_9BURK|nr:ankyrin repeat domain-containing protein [Janthinobacterium lividum]TNC78348.1 ankyrin repeat domain-containing protein [Janthinobacterium lividum]
MMKLYFKTSVFLCCLLAIVYLFLMRKTFPMASDGSGPNGDALIAFFIFVIACILHVHTFILALFLYRNNKNGTRIALGMLAASALLLSSHEIRSIAKKQLSDYRYNSSATTKTFKAISSGTPAEFFSYFDQIPDREKTWSYVRDLMADLAKAGRVDLLEALEIKGFPVVEAGHEQDWTDVVYAAVYSETLSPEQRLKVLEWLFSRAESFEFSLKQSRHAFFSIENFSNAFKDINNPSTRKVFDLLVRHDADFRGSNTGYVLWYSARFGNLDHVKFLVAQKVDPNYVDGNWHTTALDEAIDKKDQAIVQELLKAGAKKASELKSAVQ